MKTLSDAQKKFISEIGLSSEVAISTKNARAMKTYNALRNRDEYLVERTENSTVRFLCVRLTEAGRAYFMAHQPTEPAELPDMSYGGPNGVEELEAPTDATLGDELFSDPNARTVDIPAYPEHRGIAIRRVTLKWKCPVCGGKRGEPFDALSYDGSLRLNVHSWINPCGHVDKYEDVRIEADSIVTVNPRSSLEEVDTPAPTMASDLIKAKDEHIRMLEARVAELEAAKSPTIERLLKIQISDLSPMECMTRLMELKRMALQEKR
jgi:hypothetical protein